MIPLKGFRVSPTTRQWPPAIAPSRLDAVLGNWLFVVVTFGTANQQQDSGWLGLPAGITYKEILNSSWPVFQVSSEQQQTNGGYSAQISRGQILNLPYIGAVILQRL